MDLSALRALALSLNCSAHGVPATVTRPAPDDTPVDTSVIWMTTPLDEQRPFGTQVQALSPRKVGILPKTGLSSVPRRTAISAPEQQGGVARTWIVEEYDANYTDHWRVLVKAG